MRATTDAVIQALATRQHGLVTRAQLLAAGVGRRAVDGRISKELLRPLHRGVFQVGPIAAPGMRELAACLACGPTAAVGDRSAAVLWQLLHAAEFVEPVDVLVCGGERRHAGIRVRRVARMQDDERTLLDGIPVTTPARTLCDLASLVTLGELERTLACPRPPADDARAARNPAGARFWPPRGRRFARAHRRRRTRAHTLGG